MTGSFQGPVVQLPEADSLSHCSPTEAIEDSQWYRKGHWVVPRTPVQISLSCPSQHILALTSHALGG